MIFFGAVKFLPPNSKKLFKCPTCKTRWIGKCPTLGLFKTICYKYQLAFFILKLDKGTSHLHSTYITLHYIHYITVTYITYILLTFLSFYSPFLVSHSVTNTISCLLNRLTFSLHSLCMNSQIPYLLQLGVKFPIPTAVLKSNSNSLLLRKRGGCQMHMVCRGDVEVTD